MEKLNQKNNKTFQKNETNNDNEKLSNAMIEMMHAFTNSLVKILKI